MEQAQFESAVQQLAQRFQTVKDSGKLQESDWQDVNLVRSSRLPSGSGHYLRITRRQTLPVTEKAVVEQEGLVNEQEGTEVNDYEEDSESLPKFSSTTTAPEVLSTITYDIVYSPTYCVPVLYIHKQDVPPSFLASIQGAGLSLVDHPITLKPVYFVHPCRTQDAVHEVLPVYREGDGMEWLMVWFGVIGAAAGLNVPIEVAMELQR